MEEKKYGIHPSPELQKLFQKKPYQGQAPENAKIIIVGLDANYHKQLGEYPDALKLVKEYHQDGVTFWKGRNHKDDKGNVVHHPFLDKNYPAKNLRDGVGYHKNFKKALDQEYRDEYAKCICFVEMLNVPTFGVTKNNGFWEIFRQYHAEGHARWLDSIITCESRGPKLILLCPTVIGIMRIIKKRYGIFNWIPNKPVGNSVVHIGNSVIHNRKSFSPNAAQTDKQLRETGQLIIDFCKK